MSKKKINEEVLNWYATCEDKGVSSESLANTATLGVKSGAANWRNTPPSDNSDFHRCVKFKNMCPTAFDEAKRILKDEPVWCEYFKNWEKMEKLLQLQIDGENDGTDLFYLMQDAKKNSSK